MAPRSCLRNIHRISANVATMLRIEGTPNHSSHRPSGGIWLWKTTRLAGLEIGRTNEAALAMNAHTRRYGSGSTLALRTATRIAGVSTTAVASFDMTTVTTVPTA